MSTTTRKQTPAQARKAALESDYTPLYAVAGLTQAVASTLQATSAKASHRFAAWQEQNEKQARATAGDVTKFVQTLPEQVKALPDTTKARVADLQKQAQGIVRDANAAYANLAGRGKLVVDETIGSARQLGGKVQERAADTAADVADKSDPAFEQVQESVTRARKTVTGRTATKTMTPRSSSQATAKRAAQRGAAQQRAATKKATAKKAAKKAAGTRAAQAG